MSKLIIVESPTKIKTIKEHLGKEYNVVASMGHIRDLPAAKLNVDVKNNFEPKYAVIKGKEKLVKELQESVDKSDGVLLATDPDREGEAISWHLATILGLDPNDNNRITFNEITKTGIEAGIAKPRKIDMDLVNAQQARRILDRLVGYRLSPFVSQKIRRGLSAGRVQSVAVRLIVDREEEIRAFNPEEYWSIDAKFNPPSGRKLFPAALTSDENGKIKISDRAAADGYLNRLDKAVYTVDSVKKGTRKKQPAPPFITSTLQQDASRRLGFQTRRTMKVAQELYEGVNIKGRGAVGLITYMRTDSLRISEEARASAASFIKSNYGDNYLPEKPRYFKSRNNAQDAHEAIRPTDITVTPESAKESLSSDQYKLYKLIWQRFLASLMAVCVQNTVKVEIKAQREKEESFCMFSASGYSIKFDGFTVLYDFEKDDSDSESKIPDLEKGDIVKLKELIPNQHFTQPPARYTEASLVKALEENGVGRPSTYASIITTILSREYVVRDAKTLKPTELGEATTQLLKEHFPKFVSTKFTAQMETSLDEISEGKEEYTGVISEFYDELEDTLQKAKTDMDGVKIQLKEDQTDIPCEKCGRMMVVKTGRYGRFLACPGYPECKNTKPLITETGALCPKCGGKVIQRKSKKGYTFYGCSNYPNCDFITWNQPTEEHCPQCNNNLFKFKGKLVCLKDGCGYEEIAKKKGQKEES